MSDPWYDSSTYIYPEGDMWGFKRIDAAYAWALSKGTGLTVAVIDSGIDMLHPEWWTGPANNNIWVNTAEGINGINGFDDDGNGIIDDIYGVDFSGSYGYSGFSSITNVDTDYGRDGEVYNGGHGTCVAGIIAAREDGCGMQGLAPEADIMALKVIGSHGDTSDLAAALRYAADKGAKIINMSLGVYPLYDSGNNPVSGSMPADLREAIDYAFGKGCLLVAAAGNGNPTTNTGEDVSYWVPARDMKVLSVAATLPPDAPYYDETAPFTNYGSEIDVAAPGVWITTLRSSGTDLYGDGARIIEDYPVSGADIYYYADGTSMAAPFVSGLAALIWAQDLAQHGYYTLTNDEIMNIIRFTAEDLGQQGLDINYGYGLIDAYKALSKILPSDTLGIAEYIPLQTGDTANYFITPADIISKNTIEDCSIGVPGARSAHYQDTFYEERDYTGIDSEGYKLYGFDIDFDRDGAIDIAARFGDPGIILCDRTVETGRTYYAEGWFSYEGSDYIYSVAMTINGLEDVLLDTGIFIKDALKITTESALEALNAAGDSVLYQSSTRVSWKAEGIGEVRSAEVEEDGVASIYNIRSAVTYFAGIGHYKKSEIFNLRPDLEFVYLEYLDEDFMGQGYGRIARAQRSDGTYEIPYEFYAGTGMVKYSHSYSRAGVLTGTRYAEYWPETGNVKLARQYGVSGELIQERYYYSTGAVKSVESDPDAAALSDSERNELYEAAYPYVKYFIDRSKTDIYEIGDANRYAFQGLSRSFQIDLGSSDEEKKIIEHGASAYDQTILGFIRLYSGDTSILDTYVDYFGHLSDPNNPLINCSGIYRDASGAALNGGLYRMVRIEGRDSAHSQWYNQWDWAVDTGAVSYFIRYACEAYNLFGREGYKDFAVMLGEYLLRMQDDYDGGIRFGPRGMGPSDNPDLFWNKKSTEQNEDAFEALAALYEITQDSRFINASSKVGGWLKSMYSFDDHLYAAAADYISGSWQKATFDYMPVDVIALAPLELMFNDPFFGSDEAARHAEVDAMFVAIKSKAFTSETGEELFFSFTDYSKYSGPEGYGSVEWSSQMAQAYLEAAYYYTKQGNEFMALKYISKYGTLMSSLEGFFVTPSDDPLSKVAPYASYFSDKSIAAGVGTGTGYNTLNCQAALASAYYAIALTEGLKVWKREYEDGELAREILFNGQIRYFDAEKQDDPFIKIFDIDNDGAKEIIWDRDQYGLWKKSSGEWSMIHSADFDSFILADLDGNGTKEILGDCGASGLWMMDGTAWIQIDPADVQALQAADIDNDGRKELIGDYGTSGLWKLDGTAWTKLDPGNPESFSIADLDGNGTKEIIGDYGTSGLWKLDGTTWIKLDPADVLNFTVSDLDTNGTMEIIGNYGTSGLWMLDGGTWTKIGSYSSGLATPIVSNDSAYLPKGDNELLSRLSLESSLATADKDTIYTQTGALANPPKSDSILP